MKVGESRAANLGHTSGISWVEGDAQVKPNLFLEFIRNYSFPETAFSWRVLWLLHCGFWDQVHTFRSWSNWSKMKQECCASWRGTCRGVQSVETGGKVTNEVMFVFSYKMCRFLCLEFSKVTAPGLDSLYDFYSFQIIPPMGKVTSLIVTQSIVIWIFRCWPVIGTLISI